MQCLSFLEQAPPARTQNLIPRPSSSAFTLYYPSSLLSSPWGFVCFEQTSISLISNRAAAASTQFLFLLYLVGSWSRIPHPASHFFSYRYDAIPHPVPDFGESSFPGAVESRNLHRFLVKSRIPRIPVQTLFNLHRSRERAVWSWLQTCGIRQHQWFCSITLEVSNSYSLA